MKRIIVLSETGTTLDVEATKFSAGTFSLYNNVGDKLVAGVDIADTSPDFVVSSNGVLEFDLLKTQQIIVKDGSGNVKFSDIMLGDDYDPVAQKETTDSLYASLIDAGVLTDKLHLYDDIKINPVIRPFVKQMHYMFEKFAGMDNPNFYAEYKYDSSSPQSEFLKDANTYPYYLYFLAKLYKLTKNKVYANRAVALYDLIITNIGSETAKVGDATKKCWTFSVYPDYTGDWDHWSHTDEKFHIAGLILWEELGDAYIYMRNNAFNWGDVVYSYKTDPDASSITWSYFWNGVYAGGNDRVNTAIPQLLFYARMLAKGYETADLSTSTLSTLVDKIYNHAFTKNWAESGVNPATDRGGWPTLLTDTLPSDNYSSAHGAALVELMAMEGYNSTWATTWAADALDKLQKVINLYVSTTGSSVGGGSFFIRRYNTRHGYFVIRGNEDYNIPFVTGLENHGINTKAFFFNKNSLNREYSSCNDIVRYPRNHELENYDIVSRMLELNDKDLTYQFQNAEDPNSVSSQFYFTDALRTRNTYWIGVNDDNFANNVSCGFYTNDTSPGDSIVLNNNMITITYPTQTAGNTYVVKHRLGSSYFELTPGTPEACLLYAPGTSDTNYDRFYVSYYNESDVYTTTKIDSLVVTNTITFRPNKGIVLWNTAGSSGEYFYLGMFYDKDVDTLTLNTLSTTRAEFFSTYAVPKLFSFIANFNSAPFYEGTYPSYTFTYTDEAIKDVLKIAKEQFGKGIGWRGYF